MLALALIVTSCAPTAPSDDDIQLVAADLPRAAASEEDARAAATGINDFGLELYRQLAADNDNLVLSPASIALALGMARAGARGATADEMDVVLRDIAADEHAAWLNALDRALTGRSGTFTDGLGERHEVALRIANAPFAQRDWAIEAAYLEALATRFGAGLRLVDYIGQTEAARRAINGWVEEQTEGRIPELIGAGVLDSSVRLTLVNAIYLKAPWLTPFVPEATRAAAFTRLDGSTIEVPMMSAGLQVGYAAGDGWRAIELPYTGEALAMTVIVPDDLAAFEAQLSPARLDSIIGGLATRQVALTFPRFSIETKAELVELLAALGMPSAFDPARADFSGITAEERLFISDVIHQANIDVDEAGTEAAAATAVVMRDSGAPGDPVSLDVDRPFLFALRDLPTGAVLFLGRVVDPSASDG
jgi:serpin B